MYIATSNKTAQLLYLTYVGRVDISEIERCREESKALVAEMPQGFRVLVDFCRLDSMDPAGAPVIGKTMEMLDQAGATMVVRIISDPDKDIGMNILSLFHYRRHVKVMTCETMIDAIRLLSL